MSLDTLYKIITAIGVPSILISFVIIGRKLESLDVLKKRVEKIEDKTDKLTELLSYIKGKIETSWREELAPSNSPMQLNDKGKKILNGSGIKNIIDERLGEYFEQIKAKEPRNAYWVQEFSINTIYKLRKEEIILPKLETAAFEAGVDIDAILFVGGIYLRDLILPKFNCKIDEIDEHDPNKKPL